MQPGLTCFIGIVVVAAAGLNLPTPVRADFQFAGTVDSWEWTTDASRLIVVGTVDAVQPGVLATFTCRVTEVLKHPKDSKVATGSELKVKLGEWQPPRGQRVLLFFDKDTTKPLSTIWIPANKPVADDESYLFSDIHGRKGRDIDQLLANVRKRVQQSRAASPDGWPKVSDAGFTWWPGMSELDTSDDYYEVHVPPDEELRPMLEAREDLEAASILYELYTHRSKEERAADRQRDMLHTLQVAQTQHAKGVRYFHYKSFLQPQGRLVKTSPDGKCVAVLEGNLLRLYTRGGATPFYEVTNNYRRPNFYSPNRGIIFSSDSKWFAYAMDNGDVAVVDLTTQKRRSVGKLGWPLEHNSYVGQFTFSPDIRFLALNIANGEAGRGSAIVVWKTDSGEQVAVVSKQWKQNRDLCLAGFDAAGNVRVVDVPYWKYSETAEAKDPKQVWKFPNIDDHSYQQTPTEEVLAIPGLNFNEPEQKK